MENKEAIAVLRANYPDACYSDLRQAVDVAIESLKKQIPAKLVEDASELCCPTCLRMAFKGLDGTLDAYCCFCGQKLDWSE